MKKLHKVLMATGLIVLTTNGANANLVKEAASIDVKTVCDVKVNGLNAVLITAEKYNAEAIKQGVEFKRLGITNSNYIKYTKIAVKTKQKETTIEYKSKGKIKKKKFLTDYAAWRACSFAVRALQQKAEAEETWKLAVPGDGFKY